MPGNQKIATVGVLAGYSIVLMTASGCAIFRQDRPARLVKCQSSMTILRSEPDRPYRVIKMFSGASDDDLAWEACKEGADAVIEISPLASYRYSLSGGVIVNVALKENNHLRGMAIRLGADPAQISSAPVIEKAASRTRLDKETIAAYVRKQAVSLKDCIISARTAGQLESGTVTLTLEWTIEPDGSISSPLVTGPASIADTVLPGCLAQAMSSWYFPAPGVVVPISNFPLPAKVP